MPYIKPEDRPEALARPGYVKTPGELNYVISSLINRYIKNNGPLRYSLINTVVGVLDCVKHEFERSIADPYEDKKRRENGDVYDCVNPGW